MEPPKIRKLIGAMYLDVITGDVHVRNQYCNTILTHIVVLIRTEKIEPHQTSISKFRTRLHNTVNMILHNNHPLPAADTNRENEIRELMRYFERFIIKIDDKVADAVGVEQIGVMEDIESLEYCRNVCYSASADYASALTGNPAGLTDASNKFAYVINIMTPIIYRYSMVDISETDFANAARIAQRRIDSDRERLK